MLFVYSRYIGGKFRKLSYKWLQECTWMRYSVKKDGVMCAPCFLFVTSKGRPFINSDRDWKNMSILVQRHKIDKGHFSAQTMPDHFLDARQGQSRRSHAVFLQHTNSKSAGIATS